VKRTTRTPAKKRAPKNLADYFKATRTTQKVLAGRLGVTRAYVSLITSGDRQPALELAIRIAAETGVPIETLVTTPEQKAS